VSRGDTRRVPVRDRRRGLFGRRAGVELVGVSLDRTDHFTRMFPAGDTAFAVLMLPVRAAALAVLWATSAPWRAAAAGAVVLALVVLGR
jgi:hypothetical protein